MKYTPTHSSFRVFSESDLHHWITESSGRLVEDFKTAQQIFARQGADPNDIKQSLDQYRKFSTQNQLKGDEKNIDSWAKQGWDAFKDFLTLKFNQTHREQHILRDDPEWLIVIPLNQNASCYHGTNTDWCVAKKGENYFKQYVFKDQQILVYCINKLKKLKWAIVLSRNGVPKDFFDANDTKITPSTFKQMTGLDPNPISTAVKAALPDIRGRITAQAALDPEQQIQTAIKTKTRNPAVERGFLQQLTMSEKIDRYSPIFDYLRRFPAARTPEIVKFFAASPRNAFLYADSVLRGRFPEGEHAIAQAAGPSYLYALYVLRGRFPAGEPEIARDHIEHKDGFAIDYAHELLGDPNPRTWARRFLKKQGKT